MGTMRMCLGVVAGVFLLILLAQPGQAQVNQCFQCGQGDEGILDCLAMGGGWSECEESCIGCCETSGDPNCSTRTWNDLEVGADGSLRLASIVSVEQVDLAGYATRSGIIDREGYKTTACGGFVLDRSLSSSGVASIQRHTGPREL